MTEVLTCEEFTAKIRHFCGAGNKKQKKENSHEALRFIIQEPFLTSLGSYPVNKSMISFCCY